MKIKKPKISVFIRAAELLINSAQDQNCICIYACPAIAKAAKNMYFPYGEPEHHFFNQIFRPQKEEGQFGWWRDNPYKVKRKTHDFESRILALLLCAEMLRE